MADYIYVKAQFLQNRKRIRLVVTLNFKLFLHEYYHQYSQGQWKQCL